MNDNVTWKQFLENNYNNENILSSITYLDLQLKQLHSNGYYAVNINFDNIIVGKSGDISFSRIAKIPNNSYDLYVKGNIDSLVQFSLGSFLFQNLDAGGKIYGSSSCDFSKTCIQNPSFVVDHYYTSLRSNIPNMDSLAPYYDSIINGEYSYLSDYFKNINYGGMPSSNKSIRPKSTPAGRALTNLDKEENGAFIQILFYPVIAVCISILSIIVYLLCLSL